MWKIRKVDSNVIWFKIWLRGRWIWVLWLFFKSLNSIIPSRYSDINDMRWETFGAPLNTHRGFGPCVWALLRLGHMHAVWLLQWYIYWDTVIQIWATDSYWDTVIQISYWDTKIQWYRYEIQTVEIQMRYRPLGPVWVHTEALGRVLGRFCPLGTRLCLHSYDEIWDCISLSIRCSSRAWRYPNSTSLSVRWGPDMTRLFPWVLVWW